eukprot:2779284-Rhodomonas_salina.6
MHSTKGGMRYLSAPLVLLSASSPGSTTARYQYRYWSQHVRTCSQYQTDTPRTVLNTMPQHLRNVCSRLSTFCGTNIRLGTYSEPPNLGR